MSTKYFKRYRMEVDLRRHIPALPKLPENYWFVPWSPELLEQHAYVKYRSFRWELDSEVFPCLGDHEGCLQLMKEIAQRDGFLPAATWLVARRTDPAPDRLTNGPGEYDGGAYGPLEYCATIQGIRCDRHTGGIQNVGTIPQHRGMGVGAALVAQCLYGFYGAGCQRVFLEVTADNHGAVRLYRRLGFRHARTVYKSSEVAYT
jgi:ribosomal protein S18 acetylase RimI-like enzyme